MKKALAGVLAGLTMATAGTALAEGGGVPEALAELAARVDAIVAGEQEQDARIAALENGQVALAAQVRYLQCLHRVDRRGIAVRHGSPRGCARRPLVLCRPVPGVPLPPFCARRG